MKSQSIAVIASLAFLAACAPKHSNNLATRLTEAQRQLLAQQKQQPTPSAQNSQQGTNSNSGASGSSTTNPPATTNATTTTNAAAPKAADAKQAAPAAQDNQSVTPPSANQNQSAGQSQTTGQNATAHQTVAKKSATQTSATSDLCRLSVNSPTPPTTGDAATLQAETATYYSGLPLCDSANVSIATDGEIVMPQNPYFQKDDHVALAPVKITSSGATTIYTYQSLTPQTDRLVLTYMLTGVDATQLKQSGAPQIPVLVSYNVGSKNVEPFPFGAFQLESISTQNMGEVPVIHIVQPSDLKYADYTLTVQVPTAFLTRPSTELSAYKNKEYSIPTTTVIAGPSAAPASAKAAAVAKAVKTAYVTPAAAASPATAAATPPAAAKTASPTPTTAPATASQLW